MPGTLQLMSPGRFHHGLEWLLWLAKQAFQAGPARYQKYQVAPRPGAQLVRRRLLLRAPANLRPNGASKRAKLLPTYLNIHP